MLLLSIGRSYGGNLGIEVDLDESRTCLLGGSVREPVNESMVIQVPAEILEAQAKKSLC